MSDNALREYAEDSAVLWNVANFERRKAWFNHDKMPSYVAQWRMLKDSEAFKKLGTGKGQALLQKLNEAWQSYFTLLRMQKEGRLPPHIKKVKPPHYWKERGKRVAKAFFVRSDCWNLNDEMISIARNIKVPYRSGELWVGKHGRLEVLHDKLSGKWYAHFPVTIQNETESLHRDASLKASLDLGICNLATLYIEGKRPLIYSGRAVLSDWVYRTKRIGNLQSKLPRKQHTSRNILLQFRRRQRRLKHAVNAMCRDILEVLDTEGIGELFVGDLNGIRFDNDKGSHFNQRLHNFWVFRQVSKRLFELGEEYGIKVSKPSEVDTSKTCCLCGLVHAKTVRSGRAYRGLTICPTFHVSINADVNGSVNIGKVAVNRFPLSVTQSKGTSSSRHLAMPLLLRWNYNEWQ
jgi:putative transposase